MTKRMTSQVYMSILSLNEIPDTKPTNEPHIMNFTEIQKK